MKLVRYGEVEAGKPNVLPNDIGKGGLSKFKNHDPPFFQNNRLERSKKLVGEKDKFLAVMFIYFFKTNQIYMSLKFSNKVAVITGAGNGIGYEIAYQLISEGACVVLNDIDGNSAKSATDKLVMKGPGKCISLTGDAGDIRTIKQLVSLATEEFGHLDIAIANAGNTLFGDFFELSDAEFQKVVDVNLKGSFFLAQQAARQMRLQRNGGRILLMSSTIGLRAYPQLTAYSMTKAALNMMAQSLVLDLSRFGITINAIAPGATITERTLMEDPNYENIWKELIPNGKTAMPRDIAKSALFLLSEDADHITGQTLVVDGGWTAVGHNSNGISHGET